MGKDLVRRLTALCVSLSIATTPLAAGAQTAGLPGPTGLAGPADPPARVGRLAGVTGTVSYHLADAERWEPAQVNLPVTTGSAFWTEPAARAVLEAAGTRLVLDQSTELEMRQLDDHALVASLPQGRAYVHMQGLGAGDSAAVQTPRGVVALLRGGRYEVAAGDTTAPTVVTVLDGEAEMTVSGATIHVGPREAATITGDGQGAPLDARLGPAGTDPFMAAMLAQERPIRRPVVAPPEAVARMTGGAELEQYGDWSSTPDYGPVWYPPVAAGYVPYRQGRWAFVQPWGWTWVDDAPRGFAPSHYGRWAEVNDRWGWIPGPPGVLAYPVYAPAVVSFLAGAAVGALAFGSVGWVPLGPREAYYPPYRVSDNYVRNVNITHVVNVTNVVTNYNSQVVNNQAPPTGVLPAGALVNRAAATTVPGAAMTGSQPLAGVARPLPAGVLPTNLALAASPAVTPTQATLGVTPAVAQRLQLPAGDAGGRPAAPGPALRAGGMAPVAGPGSGPAAVVGSAPGAGPGAAAGTVLGSATGQVPGAPNGVAPAPGLVGRPALGVLGGVAAGAAAGALLRPGTGTVPGPATTPTPIPTPVPTAGQAPGAAGALPNVVRPSGSPTLPSSTAALPALRQPGAVGGIRSNGGAPGPALPPRAPTPGVTLPGTIGPGTVQPPAVQPGLATVGPSPAPTVPSGTAAPPRTAPTVTTAPAATDLLRPGGANSLLRGTAAPGGPPAADILRGPVPLAAPAPQAPRPPASLQTPPALAGRSPSAPPPPVQAAPPPVRAALPPAPPPVRAAPPPPPPQVRAAPPPPPPPQIRAAPPPPPPQVRAAPPPPPPPQVRAAPPPAPPPRPAPAPAHPRDPRQPNG